MTSFSAMSATSSISSVGSVVVMRCKAIPAATICRASPKLCRCAYRQIHLDAATSTGKASRRRGRGLTRDANRAISASCTTVLLEPQETERLDDPRALTSVRGIPLR